MKRFHNKVVAITGGNSGIGFETAKTFVREGAKVAVLGRNRTTLDAARETGVFAMQGDVSSRQDLDAFFQAIQSEFGSLDVLFVNAGVAEFVPFELADEAHFQRTFNINVKGAFQTVQAALPLLNNPASVILTTSIANVLGEPNTSVYAASKAALRSLAQTLSTELLPRGIRVNAVSPGPIDTPIFDKLGLDEDTTAATKDFMGSRVPVGRMGRSSEVSQAVLFLAGDESAFVAGTEMIVDGGFTNSAVIAT